MVSGETTLVQARDDLKIVEQCRPSSDEIAVYCDLVGFSLADRPVLDEFVSFKDAKFSGMILETSAEDYDHHIQALKQAYGLPCQVDSEPLQNAFGAQFSGDVATWCFDQGQLTFSRHMRDNVQNSELVFQPTLPPSPAKPYSAESL